MRRCASQKSHPFTDEKEVNLCPEEMEPVHRAVDPRQEGASVDAIRPPPLLPLPDRAAWGPDKEPAVAGLREPGRVPAGAVEKAVAGSNINI